MADDSSLRAQLLELLRGGAAHLSLEDATKEMPASRVGVRPPNCPYSAWELLEHIRLTQRDILEFSRSPDSISPEWPSGYWPQSPEPPSPRHWETSLQAILQDRAAFEALLMDRDNDLHKRFPWGAGQTLLHEALLIASHTSYHVGQLLLVRRLLGAWR